MPTHLVLQEDKTGCGLACVAMLAGKQYTQVKELANSLDIAVEDPRLWSETTYVRQLLATYGIGTGLEEKPFTSWGNLPDLALLATKYHLEQDRPFWHWCIFVRDDNRPVVYDPATYLKINARTDFTRIKPKWSISVSR